RLSEMLGADIRYIAPPHVGPTLPGFDDGSSMNLCPGVASTNDTRSDRGGSQSSDGRSWLRRRIHSRPKPQRPANWARRLQVSGLPNLHKVSNDLYRCAQPTAEGIQKLSSLGIKTVVNLRSFHSDAGMIGDTTINYEPIPMNARNPEEEEVVRFLRIVTDPKRVPLLVHCQAGAD